jgi:hypothetical protein
LENKLEARKTGLSAHGGPRTLFPLNAEVSYVTTDCSTSAYLRDCGYRVVHDRETDAQVLSAAVLLVTDWTAQDDIAHLLKTTWRNARLVWIPFVAFDPSPPAIAYGVERFNDIDFAAAGERAKPYVEALRSKAFTSFWLRGADADCSFTRTADLHINTRPWRPLVSGETVGVASLIEVEVEAPYRRPPPFVFDGVFRARAVCAGHGSHVSAHAPELTRAEELIRRVAGSESGLEVEVVANRLRRCSVGQEDVTSQVLELVDRGEREVSEFAFGTSTLPESAYDWAINSPLNEGSSNFHIGIGRGKSGQHLDLVCFGDFEPALQPKGWGAILGG